MINVAKFVKDHIPLCICTLGMAILGYLGFHVVRWIINKCHKTEKIDHVAQKNISNQSTHSPQSLTNRVSLEISPDKITMDQIDPTLETVFVPHTLSTSSCTLNDGQIFTWKNSEEISPEEMDRRVALLSVNPPKIIAQNQSSEAMIGEMAWVTPLWKRVIFSPARDKENRATIFFFEVLGRRQFQPVQQLLAREGRYFNRYVIDPVKAELIATELKFLLRRIACQMPSDLIYRNFATIVELDFGGYHLNFLPDEIGFFTNLRTLKLENCDLKKLPSSIGNLTKLQELNLGGNALDTLPDTITNCSNLFAIRGLYHQIPYSKLIQFAKDFFEKGNASVAVDLISQAIQAGPEQSDVLSFNPYSEAIDLIKQIVRNVCVTAQDYHHLSFHIIAAIDKISDESEKFSTFLTILQEIGSTQKTLDENPELTQQLLDFQDRLTARCVKLAITLPENLGRYTALRQLVETLFSIDSISEGLKVAQQLIEFSNSRPDYNYLTMIVDVKGTELEGISNMLRKISGDLAQKDKELAIQVANLIPLKNIQLVTLLDLEKNY